MKEFGIIGYSLEHSLSPQYFQEKFEREKLPRHIYHSFPLKELNEFPFLIKHHPFLYGLNVTSPYKEEIIDYLHKIDPEAYAIGAVNVIRLEYRDHTTGLTGFNTDSPAFASAIELTWGNKFGGALIFGNGGAAKAAAHGLKKMDIPYSIVSRKKNTGTTITYEEVNPSLIRERPLLINATPVGLYPKAENLLPVPYEAIGKDHFLMDMNYNPEKSSFLKEGEKNGAKIMNGKMMFEIQAELSWKIWNKAEEDEVEFITLT